MISHLLFTYILCLFKFCVELIYLCSIPLNALSIYENNYFVEAGSPRITISSSQKHGGDTYAVMNQDLRLLSHHMNNYLLLVYCNRILFLSNVTTQRYRYGCNSSPLLQTRCCLHFMFYTSIHCFTFSTLYKNSALQIVSTELIMSLLM
uniref:Uncharacterized protein n=1 Tax=Rhizophagus irregularis (strain DAOM 181602 / DAOM 197198 / MUCL 43194) TaxID=747089 RepID=U9SQZ5_RHIID